MFIHCTDISSVIIFLRLKREKNRNSLVAQWVKDLALSLLCHHGIGMIPGPGTSACCVACTKKGKKNNDYIYN